MGFLKVAGLSELPPDTALEVEIGNRIVALCNAAGTITALEGLCPHRGGPLGHGVVSGGRVVCPWHLWEFDCGTGAYDINPELKLPMYPVEVRGDEIWVDLPESNA